MASDASAILEIFAALIASDNITNEAGPLVKSVSIIAQSIQCHHLRESTIKGLLVGATRCVRESRLGPSSAAAEADSLCVYVLSQWVCAHHTQRFAVKSSTRRLIKGCLRAISAAVRYLESDVQKIHAVALLGALDRWYGDTRAEIEVMEYVKVILECSRDVFTVHRMELTMTGLFNMAIPRGNTSVLFAVDAIFQLGEKYLTPQDLSGASCRLLYGICQGVAHVVLAFRSSPALLTTFVHAHERCNTKSVSAAWCAGALRAALLAGVKVFDALTLERLVNCVRPLLDDAPLHVTGVVLSACYPVLQCDQSDLSALLRGCFIIRVLEEQTNHDDEKSLNLSIVDELSSVSLDSASAVVRLCRFFPEMRSILCGECCSHLVWLGTVLARPYVNSDRIACFRLSHDVVVSLLASCRSLLVDRWPLNEPCPQEFLKHMAQTEKLHRSTGPLDSILVQVFRLAVKATDGVGRWLSDYFPLYHHVQNCCLDRHQSVLMNFGFKLLCLDSIVQTVPPDVLKIRIIPSAFACLETREAVDNTNAHLFFGVLLARLPALGLTVFPSYLQSAVCGFPMHTSIPSIKGLLKIASVYLQEHGPLATALTARGVGDGSLYLLGLNRICERAEQTGSLSLALCAVAALADVDMFILPAAADAVAHVAQRFTGEDQNALCNGIFIIMSQCDSNRRPLLLDTLHKIHGATQTAKL